MDITAAGPPRWWTLPRLEPVAGGRGGSLRIELGRDVKLGRDLVLEVWSGRDSVLRVGDRSTFEAFGRVQLRGGSVTLDHDVHVRDGVLLKAEGALEVGAHVVLSRHVALHATERVVVGAHCGVGERTTMIDSDHLVDGSAVPYLDRPLKLAPIVVGDNVAISANCVLLRGTTVGANSVLAAGAVLNGGDFPAASLIGGLPARRLRALDG